MEVEVDGFSLRLKGWRWRLKGCCLRYEVEVEG